MLRDCPRHTLRYVGHGGSFTAKVSDSEQLRTPKVELGSIPYIYQGSQSHLKLSRLIVQFCISIFQLAYIICNTCLAESYKPGNLLSTREILVARRLLLSLFKYSLLQNITCFTRKRVSLYNLKIKANIVTKNSINPLLLTQKDQPIQF